MKKAALPWPWASYALILIYSLGIFFEIAVAQTNATTDPSEARILNSMFQNWEISATNQWNISGELCSGAAIDSTPIGDFNPSIKCDCSANNRTRCHITGLRVSALDVRGEIPDEFWSLTFLNDLNLAQNYLTGTLSPFIGNLTRMKWLTFGINALSGEIPKEIGLLTELLSLSLSTNNFSGPLPSELGNLTKLTQIYLDSAGVSGPIPLTLARLQDLDTVWTSDNAFTGRIPDFIGNNWTKLTVLRFEGNAFEGPIPASFSNLTTLTDLRISDLSNGSSSLDFLRNMKSLSKLVLRNNNISGSIPSNIGEYHSLSLLDLSFNNLTGRIPDALFNLTSLTHLFLGDNKLTGALPAQKIRSLQTIDLSYNELSGNFPSWINENLQLNLVANNFTTEQIDQSDSSSLPSGLNCLQRNFPCNRGRPIYSDFAIKCGGGRAIRSSDQISYERENETLGSATYFMTSTGRWAVSNAGLHSDRPNQSFTSFTSSQFTNTLDSELYQTARISAGSLRYYGLGLENGNYTVTLHFAESEILNPPTWRSVGRRVFDIYVQGIRQLKDFDIKREAGGRSLAAVQRQFTAQVSDNHLEIHLFWAGKGTCCVPIQSTYGPSISAISATPDFEPSVSNQPPTTKENRTGLIVGIVVGVGVISLISLFAVYYLIQKRKQQKALEDEEFMGIDTRPYTFSYSELRAATGDFSSSNKLGEGGFGPVYKGTLEDERVVAVKQLSVASHQGKSQFVAEIATISAVQHRNLVKLYGCCIEGDRRLLVYEYLENKSLDQALFEKGSLYLDWPTRFQICLGVAKGLAYLHEESRVRIVHRDVKASNILLDADLNPKISDFGLAKLYDDKQTHINTRVAGTIGYLAPEYAMRGHLTEKADVFGFGVVALEIVSGRTNSDESLEEDKIYLLEWAWQLHEKKRETELVDANLSEFDVEEVKKVIGIALLCTQTSPGLRPSMSRAIAMLTGDAEVAAATSRPGYLTDWKFKDTTTFMSDHSSQMQNSSVGTSTAATTNYSPSGQDTPMLSDIIGEGR
ncbi:probable LRR receptor-like serine/threonine-protein kinase At1g56140 [Solanum tuberosum]|uniref:probable LRR receptor-like serine/threonine-protein kinase At1g56140 n=1 Tax=Solanum tuberosum TaxID=4113 RepID=UPI00073A36B6|nr:PREDICTED: probable LRR receptor-like serine/threonine-protein kinase At1g56140 [Solanum tuberosum]